MQRASLILLLLFSLPQIGPPALLNLCNLNLFYASEIFSFMFFEKVVNIETKLVYFDSDLKKYE
jgi:hypothetical protein